MGDINAIVLSVEEQNRVKNASDDVQIFLFKNIFFYDHKKFIYFEENNALSKKGHFFSYEN